MACVSGPSQPREGLLQLRRGVWPAAGEPVDIERVSAVLWEGTETKLSTEGRGGPDRLWAQ